MTHKTFLIIVVLLVGWNNLSAQNKFFDEKNITSDMEFNFGNWRNASADVKTYFLKSFGTRITFGYTFPLGQSPFAMRTGVGMSAFNIHSDVIFNTDSLNHTIYTKIPGSINYKKNYFTSVYLGIPVLLKYTPKADGHFVAELGGDIHYLIFASTTYKQGDTTIISAKDYNVSLWNYGIRGCVGYRIKQKEEEKETDSTWLTISVNGYYSLSEFFKKGKGPVLIPYSIGIGLGFSSR